MSRWSGNPVDRFWEKVDKSGDCWLWTGHRGCKGYGAAWAEGRHQAAHRVSWELAFGAIPDGLHVLHHCDNPPCVNPDHLWLGTNSDNQRDCVAKGRANPLLFGGGLARLSWAGPTRRPWNPDFRLPR
jgi:hypothetical protein